MTTLWLTPRSHIMIQAACGVSPNLEVSGLGKIELTPQGPAIVDIYIPPQKVSVGSIDIKGEDIMMWMEALSKDRGEHLTSWPLWC